MKIHDRVMAQLRHLLENGYELTVQVTSKGDGFASPFYWNFLRNISARDNFKIRLVTNGTLMTRDRFMFPYAKKIDHLEVSVDAATEETYAKVHRGGDFKALVNNLNDLDELVFKNELDSLKCWRMTFVMQADNYREMIDFAQWALSYKALSKVWFLLIYDWGHLSKKEFEHKAIWHAAHPEHDRFLQVLKAPIFDDPRIIIGNLGALRKKALSLY